MQDPTRARPQLALLLDLTGCPNAGVSVLARAAHPGQTRVGANDLNLVHIEASDLKHARTMRTRLRNDAHRHGYDTDALVATLTVQVLIDEKCGTALRAYAAIRGEVDTNTLTYVGTVSGLQSLISDAYVAEATDAFVLKPLQWSPTVSLVANEVVPALGADGRVRRSPAATAPNVPRRVGSPCRLSHSTSGPASVAVLTGNDVAPTWFEDWDRSHGTDDRTAVGERHLITA